MDEFVCNGVRWQHARRPGGASCPASEAASAELGNGSARRGTCGAPPRGRPGPPGGATGKSPTSGGSSRRRRRRLLSLCYGARGIPGRVTCRGRLRLEGVGLEQRHRVNRDGRDDRDDRVDDEALRRVGVVRGAALLGAAIFAVVRREARAPVELDAGPALGRVAAIVAAVGAAAGAVRGAVVRARDQEDTEALCGLKRRRGAFQRSKGRDGLATMVKTRTVAYIEGACAAPSKNAKTKNAKN